MPTAHLAVYDTLADWEPGHLLAELRTGRFTGTPFEVVTVAATAGVGGTVTTMGGVRIAPDLPLDDLDPSRSDLLVLPGADFWDAGEGADWASTAGRFLDAGVPVAAICGATAGLARAGLLDDRDHTSADPSYLAAVHGYAGHAHYRAERAVADRGLVTAGPQSPVHFAAVTLGALGLAGDAVLEPYVGVFADGDPAAFGALMASAS